MCRSVGYVSVIKPRLQSPFIEPVAVEAWDAWFRWRDVASLNDVSIEDTWRRVAGALVSVEGAGGRARWLSRFLKVLATWQLLPDERLLESAGTGRITWRGDALYATLNAAAFIPLGRYPAEQIDLAALGECAEVAVRVLDNAALLAGAPAPQLRIGVVGVADALLLLGLDYDSAAGREQASALARALAEGCFRASVELAAERGRGGGDVTDALARARSRGMSPEWLACAERHGLRHPRLTAITSQPRLALLANDVADALDPLLGKNHPHAVVAPGGQRTMYSSGYALNVLRGGAAERRVDPATLGNVSWRAQIAMRAAVQRWVDESIDYPLLLDGEPDPEQQTEARRQAVTHGLGVPEWRHAACRQIATGSQTRNEMRDRSVEPAP